MNRQVSSWLCRDSRPSILLLPLLYHTHWLN